MFNSKDFDDKKAYEGQRLRIQESYEELDRARAYFEQERTNSLAYFNKPRQAKIDQRMREFAEKLGDKALNKEQMLEHQQRTTAWLEKRQVAVERFKNADLKQEFQRGDLAVFDEEAAEIVRSGNAVTSLAFLQEAANLSRQQYNDFVQRQEFLIANIENLRNAGDDFAAKQLEGRKAYEEAAYERDTAQSVLTKYQSLYGADSTQYREQREAYEDLANAAEHLHDRLNAVMETDADAVEDLDRVNSYAIYERLEQNGGHSDNPFDPDEWAAIQAEERALNETYDDAEFDEEAAAEIALDRAENPEKYAKDDIDDEEASGDGELTDEDIDSRSETWDASAYGYGRDRSSVNDHTSTINVNMSQIFLNELLEDEFRPDEIADRYQHEMHQAWDEVMAARTSGDVMALIEAEDRFQESANTFNDYIMDRESLRSSIATIEETSEAYFSSGSDADRASIAGDYKDAYRAADSFADKLHAEDKPWADAFRSQLDDASEQIERKDADTRKVDGYEQPSANEVADHSGNSEADKETQKPEGNEVENAKDASGSLHGTRQAVEDEKAERADSSITAADLERAQIENERRKQVAVESSRDTQR